MRTDWGAKRSFEMTDVVQDENLKVFSSRDVSLDFNVHVKALYGKLPRSRVGTVESEILVSARLLSNEEPLRMKFLQRWLFTPMEWLSGRKS